MFIIIGSRGAMGIDVGDGFRGDAASRNAPAYS